MRLTLAETRFLTALTREQNQTGCRGPAHDLLSKHAYPKAPLEGPASLEFSYQAVPLTGILLQDMKDLQEIDDFLRLGARVTDPVWPWSSPEAYKTRLEEARQEWTVRRGAPPAKLPTLILDGKGTDAVPGDAVERSS
jgi:hypothetical protein